MKRFIVILACLVLVSVVADAQLITKGKLIKTYTTYIYTSDDTTGFIVPVTDRALLDAQEVVLLAVATDSVHASVHFIGYNTQVTGSSLAFATWSDSLAGWANTAYSAAAPYTKAFAIKSGGANHLPGCDALKIGTVFNAAAQTGTTAGRTLKYYLWVKR